jgi:hypothetical protein
LKTALTTIFPDIGLVAENFELKERKFTICIFYCSVILIYFSSHAARVYSMAERRRFFDEFAKEAKFDPLNAANWYAVKQESILEKKVLKIFLRFICGIFT